MTRHSISAKVPDKVPVIGIPVSAVSLETAMNFILEAFENIRGEYICASNAHTTVMAYEDTGYKLVQSEAVLNLPDGKPLAVIGRKKTTCPMEKTTGTHLMQEIFTDCRFGGKRHFFYGTKTADLEKMILKIREDYPDMQICGWEPSVFRELSDEEVDQLAERINDTQADFLWIALGAPRQEYLMYRLKGKVNSLMTGVGGAFRILAGDVQDSPKWMQNFGLEWLYRLIQEPRRLFKRYLVMNTKFLMYLLREKEYV